MNKGEAVIGRNYIRVKYFRLAEFIHEECCSTVEEASEKKKKKKGRGSDRGSWNLYVCFTFYLNLR